MVETADTSGIPIGTVTFLFTDVEGSTRLWAADQEAMSASLVAHDRVLRSAIESRGGVGRLSLESMSLYAAGRPRVTPPYATVGDSLSGETPTLAARRHF